MKKQTTILIVLAVLAALMFTACGRGDNSVIEPSSAGGLNTFGDDSMDPFAEPSAGQVISPSEGDENDDPGTPSTTAPGIGDVDSPGTPGTTTAPVTANPITTTTPGTNPAPGTSSPAPSTEPGESPAPASDAEKAEAEAYIGSPLSALIRELGYPSSSDYAAVDPNDESKGEVGALYFIAGYTVVTSRTDDAEIITAVLDGFVPVDTLITPPTEPSPEVSATPSTEPTPETSEPAPSPSPTAES